MMTYDDPYVLLRIFVLALAVYREAAGEPWPGKLAVAQVIENRVNDPRWPGDYRDVILQPWQFSAFNKSDPQVTRFPNAKNDRAWEECVRAAWTVLDDPHDFANGSNHYLNPETVLKVSGKLPDWATPEAKVLTIGAHDFYKL
jgi:N-acetylmuramoyl-L-alanine amidase